MVAQPAAGLREFLRQRGLVASDADARWTPLAGGVSSDIWRVDLPDRTLCIKRALPRLKVAQPWFAPIERNAYEWAWIGFASTHCPQAVPTPVASDPGQGVFAMEFLDPGHYPVWKRLLLEGTVSRQTAAQVGAILAHLHAASAGDPDIARRFATDAIFHAIRLEPYLLATAARHSDLAPRLRALAQRTATTRVALVHGDVSPKNILVGPRGPVFVDAECAWYGDPAFDAAFCLNHFLLKCIARPQWSQAYLGGYDEFRRAYLGGASFEPSAGLEARIASLLPALTLARIDGRSPVEYIDDEHDRQRVRDFARPLVADPPARLDEVLARWRYTFGTPSRRS
ncbi:MAG TPA: aminoglycoside phosphotransferase family protein [Casimicrobiaceae bacterium]|nr:aminoglycoside phosphotransferase family protein [Casimicrobiaceae bacterium]